MSRYLEIADDVRARIVDGRYAPGGRLPSNRELADAYDTTLATLRAALTRLADEGWVRVEHGNGTYVADLGSDAEMLASFVDDAGAQVTSELLGVTTTSEPAVATRLGCEPAAPLVRLDRLRRVDDRPAVVQHSYLRGEHHDDLQRYDGSTPLYRFLRDELGLLPTRSQEELTAIAASAEVADHLDVAVGEPLLRSRRVTATHDGQPVVVDDAVVRTDALSLVVGRQGRTTTVRFAIPDGTLTDGATTSALTTTTSALTTTTPGTTMTDAVASTDGTSRRLEPTR